MVLISKLIFCNPLGQFTSKVEVLMFVISTITLVSIPESVGGVVVTQLKAFI